MRGKDLVYKGNLQEVRKETEREGMGADVSWQLIQCAACILENGNGIEKHFQSVRSFIGLSKRLTPETRRASTTPTKAKRAHRCSAPLRIRP